MGTVYQGFDLNLKTRQEPEGRPVAVKAILNTNDPELLAQAVDEREMLIRLDHPNIVRIYDIVTEKDVPYIVMGLVQGTSWKGLYDKNSGPLPEGEALRLLLGIRGAFEYLHGQNASGSVQGLQAGQRNPGGRGQRHDAAGADRPGNSDGVFSGPEARGVGHGGIRAA